MKFDNISTTKLAKICGVSQGTVDRALNNRPGISSATKEKILNAAKEYGYRPNIHARSIAGGKSQLIGVVVFDLNNQYFCDILTSLEGYCSSLGYSTVVMFTNKDSKKEIECIKNLYHMSVDGIALFPVNYGEEFENFLISLNIPIATFGNKLNNFEYIGIDNKAATSDAINAVISKGYKNLIYVMPNISSKNAFAQNERVNTFRDICNSKNLNFKITDIDHVEDALKVMKSSAIICPTDIYAIRLFDIAKKYKAGIIGFDNIRLIDQLNLKLDSVSYDVESAAKSMIDYILNDKTDIKPINHSIVYRGSL